MQLPRLSQQAIVSALFVLLFTGLAVALPGFRQVDNLLTLIQNVSILGILGLGMAVIVIGRGVDVGAIAEIHQLINRLADEGKAVVVISSYLPEVLALADSVLVARQGKVVEEFSALDASAEKIIYAAIH